MANALTEQLISKMGLKDEPGVLQKTTELLRLLELRANSNLISQVNEYGKIVLCADIAAASLGIPVDKDQALKLASLRKSQYANSKRLFEKLLDMNSVVGVRDICIQLGLNEVQQRATDLLEFYHKMAANEDVDVQHPQYAAMAVFEACKMNKVKVSKPKILPYSNLKPTQWISLEQRWDKLIASHYKQRHASDPNTKTSDNLITKLKSLDDKKALDARALGASHFTSKALEVEDYEHWKNRLLKKARAMEEQRAITNKENIAS